MKTLPIEREIAWALHIKPSEIMEWRTSKIEPHEGEEYAFLEKLGIHVCYKKKKRASPQTGSDSRREEEEDKK